MLPLLKLFMVNRQFPLMHSKPQCHFNVKPSHWHKTVPCLYPIIICNFFLSDVEPELAVKTHQLLTLSASQTSQVHFYLSNDGTRSNGQSVNSIIGSRVSSHPESIRKSFRDQPIVCSNCTLGIWSLTSSLMRGFYTCPAKHFQWTLRSH